MAVTQTGAIYKAFSFDNVSSRNYGVYITGEAVYNAPERDVEMISIPGRNGAYALDRGRFENIEVIYPAGIFADNETDFAQAVSDLRNYLCSKKGYFRLSDEYNPDEYRMAVYKSGLEVSPAQLMAGEFEIIFECKPQRWLTSGETATTVANNGTLTNPTLFEAHPMLEVEGYGTIGFNGYEIEIDNGYLGYTEIQKSFQFTAPLSKQLTSPLFNATDDISTNTISIRWGLDAVNYAGFSGITLGQHISGGDWTPADTGDGTTSIETVFDTLKSSARVVTVFPTHLFSGSSVTTMTDTAKITVDGQKSGDFTPAFKVTADITITYTPTTQTLSVDVSGTVEAGTSYDGKLAFANYTSRCNGVYAYSTVVMLGNPTYIDCDYGEAYKYEDGEYISLNQYIDLGSDLPKLASGTNTFTKDNTITELKVAPRWWKV